MRKVSTESLLPQRGKWRNETYVVNRPIATKLLLEVRLIHLVVEPGHEECLERVASNLWILLWPEEILRLLANMLLQLLSLDLLLVFFLEPAFGNRHLGVFLFELLVDLTHTHKVLSDAADGPRVTLDWIVVDWLRIFERRSSREEREELWWELVRHRGEVQKVMTACKGTTTVTWRSSVLMKGNGEGRSGEKFRQD
jgi:hypothetical protein